MSGVLNKDSKAWEHLYDIVIIPKLGAKGVINKGKIMALYERIRGLWWKRGIKNKLLYSWENWFGKAHYELKQELKAIDIIQRDLALITKNEE